MSSIGRSYVCRIDRFHLAVPLVPQSQPPRDPPARAALNRSCATRPHAKRSWQNEDRRDAHGRRRSTSSSRSCRRTAAPIAEAEATLVRGRQATPRTRATALALAGFYNRRVTSNRPSRPWETAVSSIRRTTRQPQLWSHVLLGEGLQGQGAGSGRSSCLRHEGLAASDRALALKPTTRTR